MAVPGAIAKEIARLICEEQITDVRLARQKAAERHDFSLHAGQPDNAEIQQAVIEYQRLFGGEEYRERLRLMRRTAVRAMRQLGELRPRLVGGTVNGAVTAAHRVQLHAFADQPEAIDMLLHDRGVRFEEGERNYRFTDGRMQKIPLACFEIDGIGVDVAMFEDDPRRATPINPADGMPYLRLALAEAEKLAAE
jgi:hypothetical protein